MPRESRAMKPAPRFTAFDLVIKDVMLFHDDTEGKRIFNSVNIYRNFKIFFHLLREANEVKGDEVGANKSSQTFKCVIIKFSRNIFRSKFMRFFEGD